MKAFIQVKTSGKKAIEANVYIGDRDVITKVFTKPDLHEYIDTIWDTLGSEIKEMAISLEFNNAD